MKQRVSVYVQGDNAFKSIMNSLLKKYESVTIDFHTWLSLKNLETVSADVVLINGDRCDLEDRDRKNFQKLSKNAYSAGKRSFVLMLTNKPTVAGFLHNQQHMVTDTIDISKNLITLRNALDKALLKGGSGGSCLFPSGKDGATARRSSSQAPEGYLS